MKLQHTIHAIPISPQRPLQDAGAVKVWEDSCLAIIADGAGSSKGAQRAAERVVESFCANYRIRPKAWTPMQALAEFAQRINHALHGESLELYGQPEFISTVAVIAIEGDRLYGLNAGDTAIYLLRDKKLRLLSVDHVEQGALSHVLTRAIGLAEEISTHTFDLELLSGDRLVICSDGVSKRFTLDELEAQLTETSSARSLTQAAHQLITRAEDADDLTAIILDVIQVGRMKAESSKLLPIAGALKKGDIIDGYTLLRSFHQTDRVWLAEKDGQRWVLKFAPPEAADDEARLSQFIRESWRATDLLGEFAPLAFVPAEATWRYYVMEFFDVPHLLTFLTVRKLSVDETVSLGLFLTTAAQSLLRHDLVHGDIKPENLLIIENQEQPTWKLIDLGSCTEVFSTTSRAGTASYLAPERFQQAPVSERTEIYAIGVTLYQALTGKLPHGEIERFQTPAFSQAAPPSRHNPNVPPWLDSVILWAISNDSERRYQNYSELAFDLASPQKVRPFYPPGQPLLARNPLGFYRTGFYILLVATLGLLIRLWSR